ncbi:unnamed protein product [Mycetohabitans rhizoxinica HKI 454]|uniref:Uncharacterized protein n=1 Tax=Mycetohabitans rhizoxinica (strain DSM 19002 / CIP 109453 / HKI 454) TaxID=882378 RepID=E5AP07_MYCRK|nr:unnamed protein product [Mycetohabitans rhizoxinica HKI 454]
MALSAADGLDRETVQPHRAGAAKPAAALAPMAQARRPGWQAGGPEPY